MRKKVNLALLASSILVVIMVVIIFAFSTQKGQNSVSISERIVDFLVSKVGLRNFIENNEWLYKNRNYIFRKILHFTEYAILATLTFRSLKLRKIGLKKVSMFTLFFVFVVAAADEFYQSHIPGRNPQVKDVLIDTSGALTAVLTILFNTRLFGKLKKDGAY
ncbi:VanZ family protein [Acetivibrio cellulolyticus]|uniref:VanZ family protein n=1 Tax=Acetivibrio cellulolyticus TaxID=35830 RepID=UPI0001E2C6D7|nr:VanZ family protein [Acetivibrio cellulolyticus]